MYTLTENKVGLGIDIDETPTLTQEDIDFLLTRGDFFDKLDEMYQDSIKNESEIDFQVRRAMNEEFLEEMLKQ